VGKLLTPGNLTVRVISFLSIWSKNLRSVRAIQCSGQSAGNKTVSVTSLRVNNEYDHTFLMHQMRISTNDAQVEKVGNSKNCENCRAGEKKECHEIIQYE
jgi:hypothetical protein